MRLRLWLLVAAGCMAGDGPARAQETARTKKVLLIYDMEGVTGAVAPRDVQVGAETYPATRDSLTEDVNAAIRGLLKAGATEVVLTDGHGSGNAEPDYLLERLPKGARFDIRDAPYDPFLESMDGSFAALVAVGMHGRAGGRAFLAHTYFGHTRWLMAGHEMNESMIVAASAGRFAIPLILVTGDDVLKDEIAAFTPTSEYVVVKRAASVEVAEPRPRAAVSAEIEAAAERALRRADRIAAWQPAEIRSEFENRYSYLFPEMAAVAINFPGTRAVDDKTVALRTRDFVDAYQAFRALANFTAVVRQRMLMNLAREVEGGPEVLAKVQARWPSRAQRTFVPTGTGIDRAASAMGRHGYR
jgi:D-amino peptidase